MGQESAMFLEVLEGWSHGEQGATTEDSMSSWDLVFHQYSGVNIVVLQLGTCLKQAVV